MSEIEPEAAAPEETPEPSEPEFAIDPQEWQQTQEQLQQLQQIVTPPQQFQSPPVPDPFAENYQEQFQEYVQALLAPVNEWREQQQLAAAEGQAMSTLDHLAEQGGAFDRELAWALANQIILENGGNPMKALEQAAQKTREYERRIGEQYHQQQLEQMQTIAGGQRRLPASSQGAQTVPAGGYGNVANAVEDRFFGGS